MKTLLVIGIYILISYLIIQRSNDTSMNYFNAVFKFTRDGYNSAGFSDIEDDLDVDSAIIDSKISASEIINPTKISTTAIFIRVGILAIIVIVIIMTYYYLQ